MKTPTEKFNALLAGFTVATMFFSIVYLAPKLKAAGIDYPVLLPVAALITSTGVYRILTLSIRWIMERIEPLKAIVLGPSYMHGTWIGWFRGHGNDLRYMVEHFSQDLDSIIITGRSYTDSKIAHGYWGSKSVNIDEARGELIFTYNFDVITQSTSLNGIHTSYFERISARKAPTAYSGFAHDLNDNTRIAVHSKKISTKLLSWEEAHLLAIDEFKGV